jgi:ATP-binding cassette subfamily B protein/subfamily B ATP-binding cassette protein MsbA
VNLSLLWLLTLAAAGVGLLQPWPLQALVDHVLGSTPPPVWVRWSRSVLPGAGSTLGFAAWAAVATLCVFLLESAVDVATTMCWVRNGQGAVYQLGRALFARLQRRSPIYHARTPIGDSVSRITGDSWCIYNAASAMVFAPLHALVVGIAVTVLLFRLNPKLAGVALVITPLLAVASMVLGARAGRAKQQEREAESRLESHVQQTLTGMAVVQAFAQEIREQQRFAAFTGQAMSAQRRSAMLAAVSSAAAGLVTTAGAGAVLWIGGLEVMGGRLTLGALLVFVAYQGTLNAQLVSLAAAWTSARGISVSAQRVADVLVVEPEVRSPIEAERLPSTAGYTGLAFRNITFGYAAERPVLYGVTLEIASGHTVAVVGSSGAGKSTLARLVPRLVDPWSGSVEIGGLDARRLALDDLRRLVAVVFQEPMLLTGTIEDNIRLGRPDASDAQVERAAQQAGAHEFIAALPLGYSTPIGHHGGTLSGGEQQRIAIARAFLKDSPVLVLDEPTSGLDAVTESALLDTLEVLKAGRTTLIIAHRLSTVRRADRIAVLDTGRIVELGSHEELVATGGRYAHMWDLQAGRRHAPVGGEP